MKELSPARTHPSLAFQNKSSHITARPAPRLRAPRPPPPPQPLGLLGEGVGRTQDSKNKLDNEKNYGPGVPSPRPPGRRFPLLSLSSRAPSLLASLERSAAHDE